jgi:carbonic anhydrase
VNLINACLAVGLLAWPLLAESVQHSQDATSALQTLARGNQRYAADKARHPHQSRSLRHQLSTKGQHPFAAVLACADSRVAPELIFDEGLGDLFVVRVAGNIVDDAVTGSLEYAVEHLHVPLIVVLGHTQCGAVEATIKGGDGHHSHIDSLVNAIKPAVEQASHEQGSLLFNAVRDNVQIAVKNLRESEPFLRELDKSGKLKIVGAIYDIDKGTVSYLK